MSTSHAPGARVRIRSNLDRQWVWELLAEDGHVANRSDAFDSRDACELDALQQGLPVVGLSRRRQRERRPPQPTSSKPWKITRNDDLWRWEHFDRSGTLLDQSAVFFLTEEECLADAKSNGMPAD